MKVLALTLICLLSAGLAIWNFARTSRHCLTIVFEERSGNRPSEDAYFEAARIAIDQWLRDQGYAASVSASPGMVSYTSQEDAEESATVSVTLDTGKAGGLSACVSWVSSVFFWSVTHHEPRDPDAVERIAGWWKDYKREHPRP